MMKVIWEFRKFIYEKEKGLDETWPDNWKELAIEELDELQDIFKRDQTYGIYPESWDDLICGSDEFCPEANLKVLYEQFKGTVLLDLKR